MNSLPISVFFFCIIGTSSGQTNFWSNTLFNTLTTQGLPENTPINSTIGFLQYNLSPSFGSPLYSTTSPYFFVNPQTGEVKLATALLPARLLPQFTVTFFVNGNNNFQDKVDVIVNVRPVNHPPSFDLSLYTLTLQQDTKVGVVVYRDMLVTDVDTGPNGTFTVNCDLVASSQDACSTFQFSQYPVPYAPTRQAVTVTLVSALDYSRIPSYMAILLAIDSGSPPLTGTSTLAINVANPYDTRPVFLNLPLSFQMSELALASTIIGTVQVQDKRTISSQNSLRFSISGDTKNWFALSSTTISNQIYTFNIMSNGQVTLEKNNFNTQYYFTISANEQFNGQDTSVFSNSIVTIKINNVNRFKPTFVNGPYNVNFTRQAGVSTVPGFYMLVEDKDLGDNAFFVLSLTYTPNPVPNIFSVVPTYGQGAAAVALVINRMDYLSYDDPSKRNYIITVTAAENKTKELYSSSATINFNVLSTANRNPNFPQRILPIPLYDNSPVGWVITSTIQAYDPDTGSAGLITYSFSPYNRNTDSSIYFRIDANSCKITLGQKISYQVIQQITMNVTATDGLGGQAYAIVPVFIISSNSSGPNFTSPLYTVTVPENSTNLVLKISASPLINDRVVIYALIGNTYNNLFSINTYTGIVTMNRPVDYNDAPAGGFYSLVVQASYNGWTDQPVSNASISIYIQDLNNHAPVFDPPIYTKTIPEITAPNTNLLTVKASDLDTGVNAQLSYFIQDGSRNNFVVEYSNGIISVSSIPYLSIDLNGNQYNMTLIAVDHGTPSLTGTAMVYVTITDSVYRYPVFNQTQNYNFYVKEQSPAGLYVGQIVAYSPDRRANLVYSIIRSSYNATTSSGATVQIGVNDYTQWFSISSENGNIVVNQYYYQISYSVAAVITFSVLVNVNNAETPYPLNTTGYVRILITPLAVSTESIIFIPVLPSNRILVRYLPEKQPVGTVVDKFESYLSSPSNVNTMIQNYQFISLNDQDQHLVINATSGIVSIRLPIVYADLKNVTTLIYSLTAIAPYPSVAKVTATVYYIITSVSGTRPNFLQSTYNFTINSNAISNTFVGQITAQYYQPGAVIQYTYLGGGNAEVGVNINLFPLDVNTGRITLNGSLYSQPFRILQYYYTAKATANGTTDYGITNIYISVIIVHTASPVFSQSIYNFMTQVGFKDPIGQVYARDPDIFTQSDITYSITSNSDGLFTIDPRIGLISPLNALNTVKTYSLVVQATDSTPVALTSTAVVNIFVQKFNSTNYPVVLQPSPGNYTNIYENYPDVQFVTQIVANSSRNVSFVYTLDPNASPSCLRLFSVNPQTGYIVALSNQPYNGTSISCVVVITDNGNPSLSTSTVINVNIYSLDPPTFNCIIGPIFLNAYENIPPLQFLSPPVDQNFTSACSRQKPNIPLHYKVINGTSSATSPYVPFTMKGNYLVANQSIQWYQSPSLFYNVTILVANSNDSAALMYAMSNPEAQKLIVVSILGSDTRPPSFASTNPYCPGVGVSNTIGIPDMTRMGTLVFEAYAGDCDMPAYNHNLYELRSQTYNGINNIFNGDKYMYFKIDNATGNIFTTLSDYRIYYNGMFTLTLRVSDQAFAPNVSESILNIYVVREIYKARFLFNDNAFLIKQKADSFISVFNSILSGYAIYADPVTTYVDNTGLFKADQSTMCYFMVDTATHSIQSYDQTFLLSSNVLLGNTQAFSGFKVSSIITRCYKIIGTTRYWGGFWPVWPTLVALSILVFVVAMILAYCVCWYWPRNKKKIEKHKPYVVLDEPPMSQAGSVFEYH